MGESIAGNGKPNLIEIGKPTKAARTPRTVGNPSTTTPAAGGTKRTAGGTTETEEKKPAGVPLVTPPAAEKKPRRKSTAKVKPLIEPKDITGFLIATSGIIAARPNMQCMLLSESEANSLAVPLANIIAKSEKASAFAEHTDAIALLTAALVVFAPRAIVISGTMKQQKEQKKREVIQNVRTSAADTRKDDGKRAVSRENVSTNIIDQLPAIG